MTSEYVVCKNGKVDYILTMLNTDELQLTFMDQLGPPWNGLALELANDLEHSFFLPLNQTRRSKQAQAGESGTRTQKSADTVKITRFI